MGIKPSVVARRHAEQGRIRLGHKGEKGNPVKLAAFRFTSPNEQHIRDLAALYGGAAQPWENGTIREWEVFTDAKAIDVVVLKGGVSQWMETWSGGGCTHRCDGEEQVLPNPGAKCDDNDPGHRNAKPTTRVAMMLTELESIGAWRLESHGWNAAAEIPAIAELAAYVGDLVPATLHLVPRRTVSNGQTKQYVVPVLDLRIGRARLVELVNSRAGLELEGSGTSTERRALPSPMTATPGESSSADSTPVGEGAQDLSPYSQHFASLAACRDRADLTALWTTMVETHLVGTSSRESPSRESFIERWQQRARELPEHADSQPDADGIVDGVVVEDGDPDQVWRDVILPLGGELNMTTGDLEDGFAAWPPSGGKIAADATAAELVAYAEFLRTT